MRTFQVNPDGTAVMTARSRQFPLRRTRVRAGTACGNCYVHIGKGTDAYIETSSAHYRYWMSGVKVCVKCVTGGAS